jgi:hypothetical protein
MMRLPLGQCLGLLLLLAYGAPAAAHHSFAMFDRDKTVTIAGTVKELQIINPHGWLRVLVSDPGGSQEWSIELGGPGQLDRMGLTQGSIHAGDKVTVQIHPFRDGSYGGQFVSATLPSGQVIGQRPAPA